MSGLVGIFLKERVGGWQKTPRMKCVESREIGVLELVEANLMWKLQ